MKYFPLFFLLLIAVACNNQAEQKTEVTETAEKQNEKTYGAEINADNAITTSAMLAQLESKDSVRVTVKGEIASTCKMKGCWMNIKLPEGKEMRVTFKDYGFFVPKEGMEGKTAIFEGWVTKAVISEEDRKHFAEDAGKSHEELATIVGDEEQLAFVADGVTIIE